MSSMQPLPTREWRIGRTNARLMNNSGNFKIQIYDLNGKQITSLTNQYYNIGSHYVVWDASHYSSGVYFVQTIAGDYTNTQKLILAK